MNRFAVLFFFLLLIPELPALAFQDGQPQNLPLEPVTVVTENDRHIFQVQMAVTANQQRTGLMFRTEMPKEEGMLFTYKYPVVAGFWMRNTYIPLDLIFIRQDGTIANIAHNAVPLSLATISSDGYVTGVLEINGGLAEELGLEPGDKVVHSFFQKGENK